MQVTQHEARLLDAASGALVHTWASEAALVHVVSTGANEVLASTGKGQLFLLRSSLAALECVGQADLQAEVACLDIASWTTAGAPLLPCIAQRTRSVRACATRSPQRVLHVQRARGWWRWARGARTCSSSAHQT